MLSEMHGINVNARPKKMKIYKNKKRHVDKTNTHRRGGASSLSFVTAPGTQEKDSGPTRRGTGV